MADHAFMLGATQSWIPYFGGSSGNAPSGQGLLNVLAQREPWMLDDSLDLTRARRVLALTPEIGQQLRASPRLALKGCYRHLDGREPCLFEALPVQARELQIGRDARAEVTGRGWPQLDLRAATEGSLYALDLDRCRMRQALLFPHLPALRHEVGLQANLFLGVRFPAGGVIFHREVRQAVFRLPETIRPRTAFEVLCE
jgi:hypothetical protein